MSGVLTLGEFLGNNSVIYADAYPETQYSQTLTFPENITGWTFSLTHQTIVVNPLKFDRYTGAPNFSGSQVIGYFNHVVANSNFVSVINAAQGQVKVTFPQDMYTGSMLPDARRNVPVVIVKLTYTKTGINPQQDSILWGQVQKWTPGTPIGDPVAETGYTAIS